MQNVGIFNVWIENMYLKIKEKQSTSNDTSNLVVLTKIKVTLVKKNEVAIRSISVAVDSLSFRGSDSLSFHESD